MRQVWVLLFGVMIGVFGCGKQEHRPVETREMSSAEQEPNVIFGVVKNCILTNFSDAAAIGDAHQIELMKITDHASRVRRARSFEDYVFGVRIEHLPYARRMHALVAIETLSDKTWVPGHMSCEWNRRLRMIEFMRQQKVAAELESKSSMSSGIGGERTRESCPARDVFVEYIESYIRKHLEFYELDFVERARSEVSEDEYQRLVMRFEKILGRKLRTVEQINEDRSNARKRKRTNGHQ